MYENIVCIELMRCGFEVYVGKMYQKEVDFVAVRGDEKMYIQLSDDISRPETFKREYDPCLRSKMRIPSLFWPTPGMRPMTMKASGFIIYQIGVCEEEICI